MTEQQYQALLTFLQLGGQYFVPAAVLLRALYEGMRGRLPQGFGQILMGSVLAGFTAAAAGENPDASSVFAELVGNAVFMAGLLSFITIYLLRQPFRGFWIDGLVGALIGVGVWIAWSLLLDYQWQWWMVPLAVFAFALGFIVLRTTLRHIARLLRLATWLIRIGIVVMVGAGGLLLVQSLMSSAA